MIAPGTGSSSTHHGPRRVGRAVPVVARRRRRAPARRAFAGPACDRQPDERVQPVPDAAWAAPAARPALRLRGGRTPGRAGPGGDERPAGTSGRSWSSTRSTRVRSSRVQPPATSGTGWSSTCSGMAPSGAAPRSMSHVPTRTATWSCSCSPASCAMARSSSCIDRVARDGRPYPAAAARQRIRPSVPADALQLSRLHAAVTPQPVARLEGYRLADWERGGSHVRIPRSSLTPILRLADTEGVRPGCASPPRRPSWPHSSRSAWQRKNSHTTCGSSVEPTTTRRRSSATGSRVIGERSGEAGRPGTGDEERRTRGVLAAVRTYESPLDRRLEEAGFRHGRPGVAAA